MKESGSMRRTLLIVGLLALVLQGSAGAAQPNAQRAAKKLVARLHAEAKYRESSFGASPVVTRNGKLWLAVGWTGDDGSTHVRVYGWNGTLWALRGNVSGDGLGPAQWISAVSVTASTDPDFAIAGCGAADTNCLSIVSDVGGHWHALSFEYGYGRTQEVNGIVVGHLVQTAVDACSCAGGPSTWTYERFTRGVFRPTEPPGRSAPCNATQLEAVAYHWEVQVLHFDRVACGAGWALAVGTGNGFNGRVVGLFDRALHPASWALLTLDNGLALPAAPAVYDLPLPLLVSLASRLGSALVPEVAAAKLIARLERTTSMRWPQQEGIVRTGGRKWLIALLPVGPPPNGYSPGPVGARIYLWSGTRWLVAGWIARVPGLLNIGWNNGWFAPAAAPPGRVAFRVVGSLTNTRHVITNAGGRWRVAKP